MLFRNICMNPMIWPKTNLMGEKWTFPRLIPTWSWSWHVISYHWHWPLWDTLLSFGNKFLLSFVNRIYCLAFSRFNLYHLETVTGLTKEQKLNRKNRNKVTIKYNLINLMLQLITTVLVVKVQHKTSNILFRRGPEN